jgi:predicted metal-dependent phosphoesterase TrpH
MNETKNNPPFNIDLHVHSAKYSECAESLDPQQIEVYARKAKINAVVITEHDTLWRKHEFQELQEKGK